MNFPTIPNKIDYAAWAAQAPAGTLVVIGGGEGTHLGIGGQRLVYKKTDDGHWLWINGGNGAASMGEAFLVDTMMIHGAELLPAPLAFVTTDRTWMKLHLEFHHDELYRISADATDHWIGIVCDEGGDEVANFAEEIASSGFAKARGWAETVARIPLMRAGELAELQARRGR
jgi:hypothetical protein